MFQFDVKLTSNREKVIDELNRKLETAMQEIGEVAVKQTVQAIEGNLGMERAVMTGRMKNSIRYATKEKSDYRYIYFDDYSKCFKNSIPKVSDTDPVVYIGTEVYYGVFVHYGLGAHKKIGQREFLKLGLGTNTAQWKNITIDELKK